MATTPNLSLTTSMSSGTFFSNYLSEQDSNLQKIDNFAGSIRSVSGTVTLLAANWVGTTYSLTIPELDDDNFIILRPANDTDSELASAAGLFVNYITAGSTVTITAATAPTSDILMAYTIIKV